MAQSNQNLVVEVSLFQSIHNTHLDQEDLFNSFKSFMHFCNFTAIGFNKFHFMFGFSSNSLNYIWHKYIFKISYIRCWSRWVSDPILSVKLSAIALDMNAVDAKAAAPTKLKRLFSFNPPKGLF